MLGAVADASRNLKTGTRTMPWLMDLINAHKAGSRTPSRSPENSPRDKGKGSSLIFSWHVYNRFLDFQWYVACFPFLLIEIIMFSCP